MTWTQRLILDGGYPDGLWACAGCKAKFTPGADGSGTFIVHHDMCQQVPSGRDRSLIDSLRRIIREMQVVAERKNRELDALHLVWCDGACPGGVHRWSDLIVTEELVAAAERNTKRLRHWYSGVGFRLGMKSPTADKWLEHYARRAAAKTDLLDGES